MERILLNSGPSERGWHRLESALRCPMLYALRRAQGEGAEAPPLVRGSIVHVGLAHLYALLREVRAGGNPDQFYDPITAMGLAAASFETGAEYIELAAALVRDYAHHYGTERFNVVAVEEPLETTFYEYRYTARADLIVEDQAGAVWIYDHKVVGRLEAKTIRRYRLSGQFLGLTHLGSKHFGERFAGCRLNILACGEKPDRDGSPRFRYHRTSVEPAPAALTRFPETVKFAEERIAAIEAMPLAQVPGVFSEMSCFTPYGPCSEFETCTWGVGTT